MIYLQMITRIRLWWVLVLVAAVLLLWLGIRWYAARLVDRRIMKYQNDMMERHYEEVSQMYRQTRGWRHDYHNHIQTMKAYLSMGKLEELDAFLSKLDQDLTQVDRVIKTGNVKVDAILNSKLTVAKNKGIRIEAKAIVPEELPFSEVDLSLIIGNLLDNAVEACMKVPEQDRFLRVYLDILKGQFYVYVMNAMAPGAKRHGNLYLTTKFGKDYGFGLMRIDRVVEKYHGYLNRQDEGDVFVTEIMLPL